ncbi:MAG: hypothetical protein AB8B56_02030 [Crocinitomicaceae bacterium]
MRKPKGFILLISALFLLIGSIGVSVFLHTCEEDGTFVSFFVPGEDHCKSEQVHDIPECCLAHQSTDESEDDDCCDDEMKHYKVELDFFQKISTLAIPLYPSLQPIIIETIELDTKNKPVHTYAKPPPKRRSVSRSLSQSWII